MNLKFALLAKKVFSQHSGGREFKKIFASSARVFRIYFLLLNSCPEIIAYDIYNFALI